MFVHHIEDMDAQMKNTCFLLLLVLLVGIVGFNGVHGDNACPHRKRSNLLLNSFEMWALSLNWPLCVQEVKDSKVSALLACCNLLDIVKSESNIS